MYDNALSLPDHLECEHDPNVHLYRGQLTRQVHERIDENDPITLESLYPPDFRFIKNSSSYDELRPEDISDTGSYGCNVWDLFLTPLTVKAATDEFAVLCTTMQELLPQKTRSHMTRRQFVNVRYSPALLKNSRSWTS